MEGSANGIDPSMNDVLTNATTKIKFEPYEQLTAYGSLYGLAIICIIWGSIRSLRTVNSIIRRKKKIETSISMSEAKKFPITASCVLFGLYIFFKCDVDCRNNVIIYAKEHLPINLSTRVEKLIDFIVSITTETVNVDASSPFDNKKSLIQEIFGKLPAISKANVMYLLLLLLCWEGSVALASILKPVFSFVLSRLPIGDQQPKKNLPYICSMKKGKKEMEEGAIEDASKDDTEYLVKIEFDTHDLISVLFCLSVGFSHLYKRHWITNNLLGIAFSIYGIENLHLGSFKAGTMLLAGLFIYDVFWVFATDVMTTVAKGIDAPILLQVPQDIYRTGWLKANANAMLGLGDIVLPGIFIALLRRFDHRVGTKGKSKKTRYYFLITIFAYAIGLLITMGVMHIFQAAQPALLYLVPACVLIPLSVAWIRGDASDLWNYSEESLTESKVEKEKVKLIEKKTK